MAAVGQDLLEIGGFQSFRDMQEIQAAAINMGGFTFRDDFMSTIRQYIRRNVVLWPLLTTKEPAEADVVREIRETDLPASGFFDKVLGNPPENSPDQLANDISDPGQEVKACGGVFGINHYARSLYNQQGKPFEDTVAKRTSDMISATVLSLERALIQGDATTNPRSFNGITKQIAPGHTFAASKLAGDSAIKKIRSLVRLAISDEQILRGVTHILTSSLGLELIEEETDSKLEYTNLDVVRPGLKVPGIITQGNAQGDITPIITSPYIRDFDGGESSDIIDYWLIDMNTIIWKGVYPDGGDRSFDPQMFDVTRFTTSATPYLLEKRMCLVYGTLYCTNRGEGIWRLRVEIPSGTVGSI